MKHRQPIMPGEPLHVDASPAAKAVRNQDKMHTLVTKLLEEQKETNRLLRCFLRPVEEIARAVQCLVLLAEAGLSCMQSMARWISLHVLLEQQNSLDVVVRAFITQSNAIMLAAMLVTGLQSAALNSLFSACSQPDLNQSYFWRVLTQLAHTFGRTLRTGRNQTVWGMAMCYSRTAGCFAVGWALAAALLTSCIRMLLTSEQPSSWRLSAAISAVIPPTKLLSFSAPARKPPHHLSGCPQDKQITQAGATSRSSGLSLLHASNIAPLQLGLPQHLHITLISVLRSSILGHSIVIPPSIWLMSGSVAAWLCLRLVWSLLLSCWLYQQGHLLTLQPAQGHPCAPGKPSLGRMYRDSVLLHVCLPLVLFMLLPALNGVVPFAAASIILACIRFIFRPLLAIAVVLLCVLLR